MAKCLNKVRGGRNQQQTDIFAIHADKNSKMKLCLWNENVKKAQSSTKTAKSSCAGKMKKTQDTWNVQMKWKKRQEIYIGYSSERIPYGNAKNWESLYKACRKKTNRT